MGSEFLGNEIVDESSFASFDGDYNRIDEPDDDVEGEEEYEEQEAFEYGEEQEGGKEDNQSKNRKFKKKLCFSDLLANSVQYPQQRAGTKKKA